MVNIYQAFMLSSAMECQCVCFFILTPSSATNSSHWKRSTTLHILVLSHFILSQPTRASTGMKTLKGDWLLLLFICKLEIVSVLFFPPSMLIFFLLVLLGSWVCRRKNLPCSFTAVGLISGDLCVFLTALLSWHCRRQIQRTTQHSITHTHTHLTK